MVGMGAQPRALTTILFIYLMEVRRSALQSHGDLRSLIMKGSADHVVAFQNECFETVTVLQKDFVLLE